MDGYYQYRWIGVNRAGQTVRGHLKAKNTTLAKITLHQQGITIRNIKQTHKILKYFKNIRMKPYHITHLTRRLATLLQAQIPLLQAFDLLKNGEENPRLQTLLHQIQEDIQTGMPLADALQKHPQYFNALFCHVIRAGEISGALITLLNQLATHQETRELLKQKIKKSLAYPLAILSIACVVTIGLLVFVVPQFQRLFESFHARLPTATRGLIFCSEFIQSYGLLILSLSVFSLYTLRYILKKSPRTVLELDKLILKVPLLGPTLRDIILARMTQTLSILLAAGLPLVDALKISAHITNNLCYTEAILNTQIALTEGYPLQRTLENTGLFPNMMTQIVGMGEASGQLDSMLLHLAAQQDEALKHKFEILNSLFEPILMAVLGLWVGSLIIALYLPIFQLGAIVS
ncbi:MAG: type II secretion system F family protein [Gammaproteobacteria bacterium]|nr:type II secretion system F family protein [Gammaproteobacteria bacterium]MCH9762734.1 type II secretion system F family protein [Gammaproteobacteria bacterium]